VPRYVVSYPVHYTQERDKAVVLDQRIVSAMGLPLADVTSLRTRRRLGFNLYVETAVAVRPFFARVEHLRIEGLEIAARELEDEDIAPHWKVTDADPYVPGRGTP